MYSPTIDDILGIGQTKLGFYREWQDKLDELQQAHARLARQSQANEAILEAITDMLLVVDEDLRIVSANHIFTSMFPEKPYVGQYCYSFFNPAGTPCIDCPAIASFCNNAICRETLIAPVHGNNLHFDIVASPMPGVSGQNRHVLILKRDVTLQKNMQAQMYQSEKMASIGMLATGVAHEINNPLTAITGFAEGIQRRLPKLAGQTPPSLLADLEEYTATILHECTRCRDIVQTLMQFSRSAPRQRPVLLASLIEETLSLLRHNIKQHKRVLFCLDLDPHVPHMMVDETQIRQVLLNLIINALDAIETSNANDPQGKSTGTITVRTKLDTNTAVLQVEDTGSGIAPEHLPTIFEPFFTTKPKGLGLGLSLCYSIIQTHGGNIMIQRTAAGHTLATVSLPCLMTLPENNEEKA